MGRVLPILLVLLGVAGGGAVALFLRGGPDAGGTHGAEVAHVAAHDPAALGYYKFGRPFIVPIVAEDEVVALAMLTLSIEMPEAQIEGVMPREPKVRDGIMQALIGLSHEGYLSGDITDPERFGVLRERLREAAKGALGSDATDVLIIDYARQTR